MVLCVLHNEINEQILDSPSNVRLYYIIGVYLFSPIIYYKIGVSYKLLCPGLNCPLKINKLELFRRIGFR